MAKIENQLQLCQNLVAELLHQLDGIADEFKRVIDNEEQSGLRHEWRSLVRELRRIDSMVEALATADQPKCGYYNH